MLSDWERHGCRIKRMCSNVFTNDLIWEKVERCHGSLWGINDIEFIVGE